jgi:hypothetical protein
MVKRVGIPIGQIAAGSARAQLVRYFVLVFRDSGLGDAVPLIEPTHPIDKSFESLLARGGNWISF